MKITLNAEELRNLRACKKGYEAFFEAHGENTVTLSQAFESNGWDDIWWYIAKISNLLSEEQDRDLRLLACDYAADVLHYFEDKYPDYKRPREAIEASRKFANGEIGDDAVRAAASAVRAAASVASPVSASRAAYAAAAAAAASASAAASAAAAAAAASAAAAAAADWAAPDAAAAAKKQWQEQKLKELFIKWGSYK